MGGMCGWMCGVLGVPAGQLGRSVGEAVPALMGGPPGGVCDMLGSKIHPHPFDTFWARTTDLPTADLTGPSCSAHSSLWMKQERKRPLCQCVLKMALLILGLYQFQSSTWIPQLPQRHFYLWMDAKLSRVEYDRGTSFLAILLLSLPHHNFKTFSSLQMEILYLLAITPKCPIFLPLNNHLITFHIYRFAYSGYCI